MWAQSPIESDHTILLCSGMLPTCVDRAQSIIPHSDISYDFPYSYMLPKAFPIENLSIVPSFQGQSHPGTHITTRFHKCKISQLYSFENLSQSVRFDKTNEKYHLRDIIITN